MATATTASALALLAPAAVAQVPSIELPALPDVAAQMPDIPAAAPTSAISDQYQAIAADVQKVVPTAPAPQPAAAPKPAPVATPAPTPRPQPEAERYHSESTPNVSVTQTQPQNVNVSIRINSPGDDGPVVQVNGAGADVVTNVVNHVAAPPDPAPQPTAPSASGLPASWTWVWTSACFGGSGSTPPAAAAASSGWDWRWSCDQDAPPADLKLPGPDSFPEMGPGDLPGFSGVPTLADVPLAAAGLSERPRAHEARPQARPERAAAVKHRPPPTGPPPAAGGLLGAGPAPGAIAQPAVALAARVGRAARHAVEARARPAGGGADSNLPSGAGGPSAGAATAALGAAMSLLLGTWIAVLVCALALVVPRIWLRRWSGPPWRTPAPRAARLERPG
jgi:hypothetical protein